MARIHSIRIHYFVSNTIEPSLRLLPLPPTPSSHFFSIYTINQLEVRWGWGGRTGFQSRSVVVSIRSWGNHDDDDDGDGDATGISINYLFSNFSREYIAKFFKRNIGKFKLEYHYYCS